MKKKWKQTDSVVSEIRSGKEKMELRIKYSLEKCNKFVGSKEKGGV